MDHTYEWVRGLASVLAIVLSAIAMWWSRADRSSDASRKALASLQRQFDDRQAANSEQLSRLAVRVAAIDEHLKGIPQRSDISDLSDVIRGLTHQVGELEGEQKAVVRTLDRISTFLLERSR